MGQITIEELIARFGPTHVVAPWGECVVVQGTEFDPDWEVYLGDAGYCCHFDKLDDHPVVFVPLKVKAKRVSPLAGKSGAGLWTPEQDEFLVSLWNEGLTINVIARRVEERFPCRRGLAAKKRLDRLRDAGAIGLRYAGSHCNLEVKKVEEKKIVKGCQKGPSWKIEDEQRLMKRFREVPIANRMEKIKALLPEFPGRPLSGLDQKIQKLKRKEKEEKAARESTQEKPNTDEEHLRSRDLLAEALDEKYALLRADFDKQMAFIHPAIVELREIAESAKEGLVKHKHAQGSGEAMLPMEAPA